MTPPTLLFQFPENIIPHVATSWEQATFQFGGALAHADVDDAPRSWRKTFVDYENELAWRIMYRRTGAMLWGDPGSRFPGSPGATIAMHRYTGGALENGALTSAPLLAALSLVFDVDTNRLELFVSIALNALEPPASLPDDYHKQRWLTQRAQRMYFVDRALHEIVKPLFDGPAEEPPIPVIERRDGIWGVLFSHPHLPDIELSTDKSLFQNVVAGKAVLFTHTPVGVVDHDQAAIALTMEDFL